MTIDLSLFKIADALQVKLEYNDGKISGIVSGKLMTSLGFGLPFKVEAKKVFYNDQCGVLFHIMGNLNMIVSHFPKTGAVSAFLIDGDKLEMDGVKAPPEMFISKTNTLKEVVSALGKSLVRAFHYSNGVWKPLVLPK